MNCSLSEVFFGLQLTNGPKISAHFSHSEVLTYRGFAHGLMHGIRPGPTKIKNFGSLIEGAHLSRCSLIEVLLMA